VIFKEPKQSDTNENDSNTLSFILD